MTTKQAPTGMEAFFTREKANEGIKVPLYLPSGARSEHWIEIYGVDSDEFRLAELESKRDGIRIAQIEKATDRDKAVRDLTHRLRARLVKSWSFPQECTQDAVVKLLNEAPQLGDAIDRMASNRSLFFASESLPSSDSPSTNSGSTDAPKEATSPEGRASSRSPNKGGRRQS